MNIYNHQKRDVFQHQHTSVDRSFVFREYIQSYFDSPFHYHDTYELILIHRSYGKLYIGNKVINFKDNEIYLFGPGLPHCFLNDRLFRESEENAHAIVFFFKKEFLGEAFFEKPELSNIKKLLQKSSNGLKYEKPNPKLLQTFLKASGGSSMGTLLTLLQLLHKLSQQQDNLVSINSAIPKIHQKQEDADRLEKILRYIIDNFKDDLNSKTAASIACMNEAAFCRYFKQRTEKTFSQFVNYVRVIHATTLLTQENWNIANICYECGYKNISYFNRQFKIVTDITPMEYRQKHFSTAKDLITEDINVNHA